MPSRLHVPATGLPKIQLTWTAVPGNSYQVQYKQDEAWINFGAPITSGSTEAAIELPPSSEATSYRILDLGSPVADQ